MSYYPNHTVQILANNIDHVRDILNQRITLNEEKSEQYNRLREENVKVALANMNERMKKTNEFREQLEQIIRTLASTDKVDGYTTTLNVRIDGIYKELLKQSDDNRIKIEEIDKWRARQMGIGLAISVIVPIVISAVYFLISHIIK